MQMSFARSRRTLLMAAYLLVLSVGASLSACQHEAVVAPSNVTGTDDNGGHGTDDDGSDDNGSAGHGSDD